MPHATRGPERHHRTDFLLTSLLGQGEAPGTFRLRIPPGAVERVLSPQRPGELQVQWRAGKLGSVQIAPYGNDYRPGVTARVLALADFMAGDVYTSTITLGDPERLVYVHTFSGFAQDSYQITPKLNMNAGLRWDYEGPMHDSKKDLSVFRPGIRGGIVFQGGEIANIYDPDLHQFQPPPRFLPDRGDVSHTVVRAGAGHLLRHAEHQPLPRQPAGQQRSQRIWNLIPPAPARYSRSRELATRGFTTWILSDRRTAPTCTSDNPCGVFSVRSRSTALEQYQLQPADRTVLWLKRDCAGRLRGQFRDTICCRIIDLKPKACPTHDGAGPQTSPPVLRCSFPRTLRQHQRDPEYRQLQLQLAPGNVLRAFKLSPSQHASCVHLVSRLRQCDRVSRGAPTGQHQLQG